MTTALSISPGSSVAHDTRDPKRIPVGLISNRSARGCSWAASWTGKQAPLSIFMAQSPVSM